MITIVLALLYYYHTPLESSIALDGLHYGLNIRYFGPTGLAVLFSASEYSGEVREGIPSVA